MEEQYSSVALLEKNIKLYKKYKMFAYDWVFFYAVSVLFFGMTKSFATSQIVYLSGFYTLAYCIFQMPSNFLVKQIGLKRSMIVGNLLSVITIFIYIFASSFSVFVLAQFLNGLSFALKGLSESDLLCTSMKRLGKFETFSKVEGSSNAKYYFFDAIASIISGFLFISHQYLPVILCLIVTVIALIQSIYFYDVPMEVNKEERTSLKRSVRHFRQTLASNRLKSIYMVAFLFSGIIQVTLTLFKSVLMDLGLEAQYITILVFFYVAGAGIGSKLLFYVEKKTKNRTLTVITITYISCLILLGVIGMLGVLNLGTLSFIIFFLIVMGFFQGAYKVALKKYTISFTTSQIRTRITSIGSMFEYAGTTIILFASAYLLEHVNSSLGSIMIGGMSLVSMIGVIKYMDGRIGLKPEEYAPKDVNHVKIKKEA